MVVVEVRKETVKDEKHDNLNTENLVHLLFEAGRLVGILALIQHNFSVGASSNNDALDGTVFDFSSARQEVLQTNDLIVTRSSISSSFSSHSSNTTLEVVHVSGGLLSGYG
jgi:hypothetical protein